MRTLDTKWSYFIDTAQEAIIFSTRVDGKRRELFRMHLTHQNVAVAKYIISKVNEEDKT